MTVLIVHALKRDIGHEHIGLEAKSNPALSAFSPMEKLQPPGINPTSFLSWTSLINISKPKKTSWEKLKRNFAVHIFPKQTIDKNLINSFNSSSILQLAQYVDFMSH